MHVTAGVHIERGAGGVVGQAAGKQDDEGSQVGGFGEAVESQFASDVFLAVLRR